MQDFITKLLTLIFPLSREALLVSDIVRNTSAQSLISTQNFQGVVTLSQFKNPHIRALIHEAKFHHNEEALNMLAQMVKHYLTSLPSTSQTTILPIPLSSRRLRERGYNQATEVVRRAVTNNTHFILNDHTLVRRAHTKPQTTLARSERLINVQNAFSVLDGNQLTGKHLIIFDDVVTTGATLNAATTAIIRHKPASVLRLALAH